MAVLRALTKIQREKIEASKKAPRWPTRLITYDAHVTAYHNDMIENYVSRHEASIKALEAGKPLRAQKWYQSDYRSFTPKGVVLITKPALRGTHARFAVK
jgi:hypothetical protein